MPDRHNTSMWPQRQACAGGQGPSFGVLAFTALGLGVARALQQRLHLERAQLQVHGVAGGRVRQQLRGALARDPYKTLCELRGLQPKEGT